MRPREVLRAVIAGDMSKFDEECGLCANTGLRDEFLHECAESWPEFSGDHDFPVPHPEVRPYVAYFTQPLYMWEYGETRKRYAQHILNCLDAME